MPGKHVGVRARVSSSNLLAVKKALEEATPGCSVSQEGDELILEGHLNGGSAKELNRSLLSAMRRVEKRTRLRAEWTMEEGTVERYFDYVLKKTTDVSSNIARS